MPRKSIAIDSGEISPVTANNAPETAIISKYRLGEIIGYGSCATVYRAWNIETEEIVAIKVISKRRLAETGLTAHVSKEITAMRRLRNHRYIIKLIEVISTDSKIYLVTELAGDGELFKKVLEAGKRSRGGGFGEDFSRRWFHQLITAVKYCHSHGVFHRDIKPENLLLDEKWNIKVSDFGLSAVSDCNSHDRRLRTVCGTIAYAAPEILTNKEYDGAKADLWSCGVVLYVLITGALPFDDENVPAMCRKMHKGEFRMPQAVSSELKRLLLRLLDPNPERRIGVDEIMEDPWFKKDYEDIDEFYGDEEEIDNFE